METPPGDVSAFLASQTPESSSRAHLFSFSAESKVTENALHHVAQGCSAHVRNLNFRRLSVHGDEAVCFLSSYCPQLVRTSTLSWRSTWRIASFRTWPKNCRQLRAISFFVWHYDDGRCGPRDSLPTDNVAQRFLWAIVDGKKSRKISGGLRPRELPSSLNGRLANKVLQ